MKRKKICFVSHHSYALYNKKCKDHFGGGAEVQLYLLSKELAKNKSFDINVINGKQENNKNLIEIYKNIKIFKVLPVKKKIINYLKAFILFFLFLRKINPDILIQRAAGIITGLCALYCKLFRTKFIYSISSISNVNGRDVKGIKGKIFKFGISNADYVIAQNKEQISMCVNNIKKNLDNIYVIKNGFKIQKSNNIKKKYILWVGRAINIKRPEIFLKIAEEFPNEPFLMICYKENDIKLWKMIKKNASKISNLNFLEFVPFHKIDQYFNQAKLFINTSNYEGFPNTYIQAFKNQIPVISLNVNPDGIFIKNQIGFFCENNIEKMINCINEMLKNKEIYDLYAKNAFLYAKNNHDIKKISQKWVNLIERLVNFKTDY